MAVKNKNKNHDKNGKKLLYSTIIGLSAGLINGLFGGGGGMVVVPMLMFLLKYLPKNAHATAILIILPLSLISGMFYSVFGSVKLDLVIPVLIGVVSGGILGAFLLPKLSSKWLVIIFSTVMAVAGLKMLFF